MAEWLSSLRDPREPVRRTGIVAGAVVGPATVAGVFLTAWGSGIDWRLALGQALVGGTLTGGAPVVAAEIARAKVTPEVDASALAEWRQVRVLDERREGADDA